MFNIIPMATAGYTGRGNRCSILFSRRKQISLNRCSGTDGCETSGPVRRKSNSVEKKATKKKRKEKNVPFSGADARRKQQKKKKNDADVTFFPTPRFMFFKTLPSSRARASITFIINTRKRYRIVI